jgi:predicted ATPase
LARGWPGHLHPVDGRLGRRRSDRHEADIVAMVFDEIRIENFKLWQDTQSVLLAPITVLFGTNSSGKSSIEQFLLMLKQTAASSDRVRVLHAGDRSTPVDVGDFPDYIHHHDVTRPLRFRLAWTQPKPLVVEDALDDSFSFVAERITFSAELVQGPRAQLRVARLEYLLVASDGAELRVTMAQDAQRSTKYRLAFEGFEAVRNKGRPWELPSPIRFYGFPDEAIGYFQNTAFLADLSLALERQLGRISYLGPVRTYPRRYYLWSGTTPEHVGWQGEETVEAILASRDRLYNFKKRQAVVSLEAAVARWLKQLGLIDSFEVSPIAEGRPHQEVRVRVQGSPDTVLLTDVGFGVSQVLPVLVQCLYAEPDSTIVLEQPELHLHPKVQMALADVLIQVVRARENSTERRIQMIIESHSEHFLRRLQRRIAEASVEPSEVALYFCDVARGVGRLRQLEVDLFGDIGNWPHDFFGDPMEDIAAQAEARLIRVVGEETG